MTQSTVDISKLSLLPPRALFCEELQDEAGKLVVMAEHTDELQDMNFHSRRWVKPEDLNANGTLFGGSLLRWIDEEAAIYAILQLGNERVVTKFMSEIDFVASAWEGDLIEMGLIATHFGRTSLTLRCVVRNMITRHTIITINKIVFVNIGPDGLPAPHGYTEITTSRDRIPKRHGGRLTRPTEPNA